MVEQSQENLQAAGVDEKIGAFDSRHRLLSARRTFPIWRMKRLIRTLPRSD